MKRYSVIDTKMPREFVLLQGTGCRWKKCTFCDYHHDVAPDPYAVNQEVLSRVTGVHGVLDIINSGSCIELDGRTLALLKSVIASRGINTVWFESHWRNRNHLANFADYFAPVKVKFRCGIETFDGNLRKQWCKGVGMNVSAEDVAQYFDGVCLLCCTRGEDRQRILDDIAVARRYFEYLSVNVFCNNTTTVRRDEELADWFRHEVYPKIKDLDGVEVLMGNTDLGVG